MRLAAWTGVVLLTLLAAGPAPGGEPGGHEPAQAPWPERVHPAGGWHPYGGGLLHWWPEHCSPRCGAQDDYCRKPLPAVCLPAYPPFYVWGPPEVYCPRKNGGGRHSLFNAVEGRGTIAPTP